MSYRMVLCSSYLVRILAQVAVVLTLFTLATGCNDTGAQKALSVAAATRFQALYNSGSCQQIYDGASHYFQSHETRPRWLRDCAELRGRFGTWSEFTPASNNAWPIGRVGIVWVRGSAKFSNGPAEVRLDWELTNGRAVLFNVLVEAGGQQISVPGFTGEIRN
jgi:hypothetical protein